MILNVLLTSQNLYVHKETDMFYLSPAESVYCQFDVSLLPVSALQQGDRVRPLHQIQSCHCADVTVSKFYNILINDLCLSDDKQCCILHCTNIQLPV